MGVRPRAAGTGIPPRPPDTTSTISNDASDSVRPEPVPSFSVPRSYASPSLSSSSSSGAERLSLEQMLAGEWYKTPEGACLVVERRYPVDHPRGPVSLGHVLHARPSVLWDAGRVSHLRDLDARKLLFLDTETTGLSGGTGTYVFLVGVGFFSPDGTQAVIRQYFMPDVSAERAMLHALNELFCEFGAVVTFNGKSFDWPLLETRYTYSRLRCVLRDPPHLDMLGPSRRLWKERLPSCSLDMLEMCVLGVDRGFDVPGWRIPSLYFQYLRAGHPGHVLPVFSHNEQDLLTLMALAGHVGRILDRPDEVDLQAAEWFGLGKLYEDLGRYHDSLRAYERGLELDASSDLRAVALRRLSYLYKYLQQREEAVAIWSRLAAEGTHLMFPYLELAKHYEHRVKDYRAAEHFTLLAMQRARTAVERAELEHRLNRVRKRLLGTRTASSSPRSQDTLP